MYLQDQYSLGPSFGFQLQTIQHHDLIFHLCFLCPPTLIYMTANALMGFVVLLLLVVEPDYLPDSEVLAFIHAYTP
jgi:hypothetical protein